MVLTGDVILASFVILVSLSERARRRGHRAEIWGATRWAVLAVQAQHSHSLGRLGLPK